MRRAARVWAGGDSCEMCPLQAAYPTKCVSDEPDLWRPDDVEEGCTCPILLKQEFTDFFMSYNMLQNNVLPFGGKGYMEQPALWVQGIEIITGAVNQLRQDRREKNKN